MKFLLYFFAFVISTSAFSEKTTEQQLYYKPGADVQLTHDYDGNSDVDTTEEFSLFFTTGPLAASTPLTIRLNPSSELELLSEKKFALQPENNEAVLPVRLRAHKNGLHYLGVHAEVVDASGHRSFRVFK